VAKLLGIVTLLLTVGAAVIVWASRPRPLPATSTDSCSVSIRDPRFVCTCRATVPGHMEAACELSMEPAMDPDEFVQQRAPIVRD
jgi:hypothetical protein